MDETAEARSFHEYKNKNKDKMSALSIEATWLALKGACTVRHTEKGTIIDTVNGTYGKYMGVLDRYSRLYKLSTEERQDRLKKVAEHAKVKLVG